MSEHRYDDMTEPEMEAHLNDVARSVDEITPAGTGFIVLLNPFLQSHALTQYVCNGNRDDAVKWLRIVADRLDAGDTIERVRFPGGT